MTKPTVQAHPNRIAGLVNRPGGMTEDEAVSAANANLDSIKDRTLMELEGTVQQMLQIAAALQIAPHPADIQKLYAMSNTIVGVAGAFGMGGLSAVAYSLCELIDRFGISRTWNAQSVRVHLESMVLMQGDGPGAAEELQVKQALRRLVDRVPTAG